MTKLARGSRERGRAKKNLWTPCKRQKRRGHSNLNGHCLDTWGVFSLKECQLVGGTVHPVINLLVQRSDCQIEAAACSYVHTRNGVAQHLSISQNGKSLQEILWLWLVATTPAPCLEKCPLFHGRSQFMTYKSTDLSALTIDRQRFTTIDH